MNLAAAISMHFGGPGSGCHGPNCGRPSTGVTYLHQQSGTRKGTNQGGFYKGSDGVNRYVKFYKDDASANGEDLASKIYNDLGIGAPKTAVVEENGKKFLASDVIEKGVVLNQIGVSSEIARQIMKGFAADVLTANWDAVGLVHDNILVKSGTPYRIDNGGSFLMRAMASSGRKPSALLNKTTEIEGFFNHSLNHAYADIANKAGYNSASDMKSILKPQVDAIVKLRDDSGGWQKYVDSKSEFSGSDKQQVVDMLNARTKALQDLVR